MFQCAFQVSLRLRLTAAFCSAWVILVSFIGGLLLIFIKIDVYIITDDHVSPCFSTVDCFLFYADLFLLRANP